MWDWVLLVASLLTALYLHLIKQHQQPARTLLVKSAEPVISFDPDKLLSEIEEMCSVGLVEQMEDQLWASTAECPDRGIDHLQQKYLVKLRVQELNCNDLLVKNMTSPTDKSKPHSAVVTTCMLSKDWQLLRPDNTNLRMINSTAFSIVELNSTLSICNIATKAYSIMETMGDKENMFTTLISRRQNRITNLLANITDELKNKNPNGN